MKAGNVAFLVCVGPLFFFFFLYLTVVGRSVVLAVATSEPDACGFAPMPSAFQDPFYAKKQLGDVAAGYNTKITYRSKILQPIKGAEFLPSVEVPKKT